MVTFRPLLPNPPRRLQETGHAVAPVTGHGAGSLERALGLRGTSVDGGSASPQAATSCKLPAAGAIVWTIHVVFLEDGLVGTPKSTRHSGGAH